MMKTVCQTYKYPFPKGFGAWIRSCIAVCTLCEDNGWEFDVHFNTNPIRTFLKYKNTRFIDKVYITHSLEDIKTVFQNNPTIDYIFIEHDDEITMPKGPGNVDNYETYNRKIYDIIINKILQYNYLFTSRYKTLIESLKISPQSYDVLHIRLGDIVLIDERDICMYTKNAIYEEIDRYVETYNPKTTLLICDSYWIKLAIAQKYNFIILETIPSHSSLLTDKTSILDTLIDFHLLCMAKSISVISCVTYTSNFSLVPHALFNIPYKHTKISIPSGKPICWSCKKLKQRRIKLLNMYIVCEEVQNLLDDE